MRCLSCSCENEAGAQFCEECGTPLVRACPSCGREVRPTAKFCSKCGASLTPQTSPTTPLQSGQPSAPPEATALPLSERRVPEAERRQLTVMFCDLVGSTPLAEKLDPEDLRQVILAYQQMCAEEIRRFDGYLARYVGDGLLVYFSYPQAHEDDAQRAIRAGLGIVAALPTLNTQLQQTVKVIHELPLQVRIGIHTGLVVVGDMGGGGYRDPLAIVGETPNIAARVQGIAEPNTVVISAATYRLVQGLFECRDRGPQALKGVSTPVPVYRVLRESEAQSRFEATVRTGLTPLVGRVLEVGLLQERWQRAAQGAGQVVLLSGEPGIGKSRLVQVLKEQTSAEGATRIEFRCSPYHQNSAFYPITEHLQRFLQFHREETPQTKLSKLQQTLAAYHFPQADTLPLLAALLSLPHPEDCPPLTLSPQKQKQKTQEALVAWLREDAERQAVCNVWEDLHWADPSTLEVLALLLDQVPTTRLLAVLTFRPDFTPPWGTRSYLTQLTLGRLDHPHVETMVEKITGGKTLPAEVVQQVVAKTDGVPLFVEELSKMVLEAGWLRAADGHYELTGPLPPLAIPSTLQDSLMARLDRLALVKEIAQLGATLGREFSYELLRAVSPLDEATLQQGLRQLVEAELVYQRGIPPQATYFFKHALIQDTAYQSLLKSTRQQYHRQIAHVLEERFAEITETQPELLAHHYTAAGLSAQAIPYWQRAGERASQRSAYVEAISHLTRGLELLKILPDTPERAQQELTMQIALGTPLLYTKGYGALKMEQTYSRALALCRQVGETPLLFSVLGGLFTVYLHQREYHKAQAQAEQLLHLAETVHDPARLMVGHTALALALRYLGELPAARTHFEQGLAWHDSQRPFPVSIDCLSHLAHVLWELGYPEQALDRVHEALAVARQLSLPFYVGFALHFTALLHYYRREERVAQERAEAAITLSREQGFPFWVGWGTILRGAALAEQGQGEADLKQIHQGLDTLRAIRSEVGWTRALALLARAYEHVGQAEAGLSVLAEALDLMHQTRERYYEVELVRLKGELTLQAHGSGPRATVAAEAEECFHQAIAIARGQSAKSWELRAVMSLSRLWQQQGKREEARQMLAEIYDWFTEGFETKDLQEAKALLEELA